MAAQIAALNPKLPATHAAQLLRSYIETFDSVQEQLKKGKAHALVPLTNITLLRSEGVELLKEHLENSANVRFTLQVNASANTVIFTPTGPMPPKSEINLQGQVSTTGAIKTADTKVPRPSNPFILYRKDWHARTVAQNPGVHNNTISVILGNQWRNESADIRAIYEKKAKELKKQHAIDNPGYHYQPRKPSEKKKRMTKNKMAKLAVKAQENNIISGDIAQQPLPDDFDPISMLDEQLEICATTQPLHINKFGKVGTNEPLGLNVMNSNIPVAFFDTADDPDEVLRTQLETFNAQFALPPYQQAVTHNHGAGQHLTQNTFNQSAVAHTNLAPQPTYALTDQSMFDGQWFTELTNQALPGVGFHNAHLNALVENASNHTRLCNATTQGTSSGSTGMAPHDPNAEVERQEDLTLEVSRWFDMDGYDTAFPDDTSHPAGINQ